MLDIGWDLDGVMYSFDRAMAAYLHRTTGRDLASMPVPDRWNTWEVWDLEMDEFLSAMNAGISEGFVFRHGTPYPGAVETVKAMAADGHRIHIVTDRGRGGLEEVAKASTVAWLAEQGVPYDSLTISADKTVVRVDAFIEDRDKNYLALLEHGSNPYLVDQPWNRHVDAGARRLEDVTAFADVVAELAAASLELDVARV